MDMLDRDLTKVFSIKTDIPLSFETSIKNALYTNNDKVKRRNIGRFIIAFVITGISSIGVAFAGTNIHEYFSKTDRQNFDIAPGIYQEIDEEYGIKFYDDNNYGERYYYKFITTHDDYDKCKERWPNLYEMQENDFAEYDILMISWLGLPKQPIYLSNIYTDENTLYINLKETEDKDNYSKYDDFYSIKISKEDYRENISINIIEIMPHVDYLKYTDVNEIIDGKEYTVEQALEENCFVVEERDRKLYNISNDKECIDKFIEDCKNGKPGFIRTVSYYGGYLSEICDVEYRDGKYYVNQVYKKIDEDKLESKANIYVRIIKRRMTADGINYYWFVDVLDEKDMGISISMYDE